MSEQSTTPDLVERTRGLFVAAEREDLAAILASYSPDAVFDMSAVGLGTYRGPQAIGAFWADWLSAYEESEIEVEELLGLSNGIVLVLFRQHARPRGSSGQVRVRTSWVFQWKHGMVERVTNHPTVDEARAAAEHLAEEQG